MTVISCTAARNNLAAMMNKVCADHDPVIITRQNAEPVVTLSLEDYESLRKRTIDSEFARSASQCGVFSLSGQIPRLDVITGCFT
jgi:prevent-host-death family protein